MTTQRTLRHDSELLLARLDSYLVTLRSGHPLRSVGVDLSRAERVASALRTLVVDTAHASAADRARVRAAVHCFVSRGIVARVSAGRAGSGGPTRLRLLGSARPERRIVVRVSVAHDLVVNALLRELGRHDLVVPPDQDGASSDDQAAAPAPLEAPLAAPTPLPASVPA